MAVRSIGAWTLCAVAFLFVSVTSATHRAQAAELIETVAGQAMVVDIGTGAVLLEKNADAPFAPASLAKLMTAELVFRAIESGAVTLQTAYPVSEYAWRTGGAPSRTATMFAAVRSTIPVEALLRGLLVQGANDAAIILAEGLEGTEGAFVAAMNERALELGMRSSTFVNPTGLPADGQSVTARDMAILAERLATAYPDLYPIFAEPDFLWNGIRQSNRNPLLTRGVGATGMATGFTEGVGYSIVAAAEENGRSTIAVLGTLESEAIRTSETIRLLDWAESSFEERTVFAQGSIVGPALVYGGVRPDVPLRVEEPLVALVPRSAPQSISGAMIYEGPLRAPISAGEAAGQMVIRMNGRPSVVHDLFAAQDVAEGSFSERALGALRELAFGWIRAL